MSQSGILNRGIYPPGTVVETLTGNTGGAVSPSLGNNINLISANANLTIVGNLVANTLTFTASTSPVIAYRLITFDALNPTVQVNTDDEYIAVDARLGIGTIELPTVGVAQSEQFIIKDLYGVAFTNNITVTVSGVGGTIDQAANAIINSNRDSLRVIYGSPASGIPTNFERY